MRGIKYVEYIHDGRKVRYGLFCKLRGKNVCHYIDNPTEKQMFPNVNIHIIQVYRLYPMSLIELSL